MSNWKFWTWGAIARRNAELVEETLKHMRISEVAQANLLQAREEARDLRFEIESLKLEVANSQAAIGERDALKRRMGWEERARTQRTTEEYDKQVFAAVEDTTPWWRVVNDVLEDQKELDTMGAAQQGISPYDRAYRAGLLARTVALRDTFHELRERAQTPTKPE